MCKAQEVEGLWLTLPLSGSLHGGKAPEPNQPRLLAVQFQSELRHPLAQLQQELLGILAMFKAHHEVICIAHKDDFSACVLLTPVMCPRIQDIMEVYIGQQRRDGRSLRSARFAGFPLVLFDDSSMEPFANQAQQPPVSYPVLEELHHPFVADVVKEATNVCVQHPVHFAPVNAHGQRVKRLMRSAPWPEPIGEAQEVRLIDGVEEFDNGCLYDFIFQGSHA